MNDSREKYRRISEQNKVSGLSYVFTDTGLELPVLDITHPLFEFFNCLLYHPFSPFSQFLGLSTIGRKDELP